MTVDQTISIIIASLGVFISIALFNLNREIRKDQWAKNILEFQKLFWANVKCEQVRSWIACDSSYSKVEAIIKKRNDQIPLSNEEYKTLEAIDTFAATLAAHIIAPPNFNKKKNIEHRLFFDYWITSINNKDRLELKKYLNTFYPELFHNYLLQDK